MTRSLGEMDRDERIQKLAEGKIEALNRIANSIFELCSAVRELKPVEKPESKPERTIYSPRAPISGHDEVYHREATWKKLQEEREKK
jgi:hypothetical protein